MPYASIEKRRQYQSKYSHKQYQRLWYLKNKDRLNEARKNKPGFKEKQLLQTRKFRFNNPWYTHWQSVKQRCNNPNHCKYPRYGGRGIKCFLSKADVQFMWIRDNASKMNKPSIDRRDNTGNYCLENCKFMEVSDNSRKGNRLMILGQTSQIPVNSP